ncbi:MAG: DUF4132 domain-containing protein, partial [Sandaracinaceae bacterium]|nr:DUF4132 domain-containing protein [Sandaracinaceae bacterium]
MSDPLEALLAFDRPKRLPTFVRVDELPALSTVDGAALPRAHAEALVRALVAKESGFAALRDARAALEPVALDAFVVGLFEAWRGVDFHGRHGWVLEAVASLGGDRCALALAAELDHWPTQSDTGRKRALGALEVLRRIGTDTALLALLGLGQREVLPSVALRAARELELAAKARRLTVGALGDHITPSCGLDERGVKVFDYGARRFEVAFDEHFEPRVRDASGELREGLPAPEPGDDAAAAERAVEEWRVLAGQLESITRVQSARLEDAMITERRWTVQAWTRHLWRHPLMVHFTRRLVWGRFDDQGTLAVAFRTSDDGSLVDVDDEPITLSGRGRVGIVHPLHLPESALDAWGDQLADYELVPPFEQLTRPTLAATEEESSQKTLTRFADQRVEAKAVHDGFIGLGWTRDEAVVRQFFQKDYEDGALRVRVHLDPGIHAGMSEHEPEQAIPKVVFRHGSASVTLGKVSPVAFSEVVFAIER